MILGTYELADSDVRVFFKDKQQQNEKVAGWTDATLVRLGRCYKTMPVFYTHLPASSRLTT